MPIKLRFRKPGRFALRAAVVLGLLAAGGLAQAGQQDAPAATTKASQARLEVDFDPTILVDWFKIALGMAIPEPFNGLVGDGIDLVKELASPEQEPSAMEQQLKRIEGMMKDALQLSQSIQSSLDNLAQTLLGTEFNNTIERRLLIVNDINTLYGRMYLPSQGTVRPFPRPEKDFYAYAGMVAANPGSYQPLINDLGGFVPARAQGGAPLDLTAMSHHLMANLAPQNVPVQEWYGLQDKYRNLLTVDDKFAQYDPALSVATANRRIASLQMAYANSVSKLYHLWSLKLALYYADKSLFVENGKDKLNPPFHIQSHWTGESGYRQARRQAYVYYQGIMHNQFVAVFGGRKAKTAGNNDIVLNGNRIVYESEVSTGAVTPFKTRETVDLINRRVSDSSGDDFIERSFPENCAISSVAMRKEADKYRVGSLTGHCRAAEGTQRINLTIPYHTSSSGLNYENITIKRISVSNGRITAAKFDGAVLGPSDLAQDGYPTDGPHWALTGSGADTGWDITCGLFSGSRYDFSFRFGQGSIQAPSGGAILAKKSWGHLSSSLDSHDGYSQSMAGSTRIYMPSGSYDESRVRYDDLDAGYWNCMNRQFPTTEYIGSSPQIRQTVHNSAFIYGLKGEAFYAATSSGRLFTINYFNPDNMALPNRSDGDRYHQSGKPNYARPHGGWISTLFLKCLKDDATCHSDVINGTPVVYWRGGNNLEIAVLVPSGERDLRVAHTQVPGDRETPPICKEWRQPSDADKPGDIYSYVNTWQNNRKDYFRLRKAPYGYFPTNGTSNDQWEFLGHDPACIAP